VEALGLPWQAVAKSLRRLVGSRRVLVTEVEHQDHRYRVRRVRYYRRNLGMVATLPEWLAPRVHVVQSARLVKGRAGEGSKLRRLADLPPAIQAEQRPTRARVAPHLS
jgi:hypothetical protein